MKNIVFVLFILFTILLACESTQEPEIDPSQIKADSLQALLDERDQTVNEFFETFNEIEENLATIKEKEKIITVSTSDGSEINASSKDKINEDILLIYDLLTKNKQKIAYLNKKMKESDLQILELNKMIQRLTEEITNKDSEINKLKEELAVLNIIVEEMFANIDTLTMEGKIKDDVISEQDQNLNTAFYVAGTSKELKEKGIITKEGGFVGIGAVQKLMEDFNKDYFTKIDIRQNKKISLMVKKAKIITSHSSSSYYFDGPENKVNYLIITDYEKFWQTSKYLVIIVE
ncbi:MAG: hypothetical protein ABIJ97_05180 [Bacteroidota bacterium]